MKVPFRVKRMMFIAFVCNAAFSGFEAFVLQDRHYRALDTTNVKLLRSLLGGCAAFVREGEIRTLSNAQVFAKWRLASSRVELRIRRIEHFQS
mmetsp:Transcript_184684/g.585812  ORF Transcript_184684/g.585812 Transcript_184684/m.585812 type:complete len:93 (+) Transcript_184684:41-319(+)